MLMSNSYSPGLGALEHAMDALAQLFADCRDVLFVPYATRNREGYTQAMREILATLGLRVVGAHRVGDPLRALAEADAVFVGGGNAFLLLQSVQRTGLLPAIGERVRAGMPYLGVSAGANLACPTIRTTNDMPIVQPTALDALGLIPFQVNPHYPDSRRDGMAAVRARDERLEEFLEENDVPVLGLCEGSWLDVRDGRSARLAGTRGARLFTRGGPPRDLEPGDDLSPLLHTRPHYDTPLT
jgi:dipeptidase E